MEIIYGLNNHVYKLHCNFLWLPPHSDKTKALQSTLHDGGDGGMKEATVELIGQLTYSIVLSPQFS